MANIKIPKNTTEAKLYSSQVKQGKLLRIYRGVYTDAPKENIEVVVRENWMKLVTHLVPTGILSLSLIALCELCIFQIRHKISS